MTEIPQGQSKKPDVELETPIKSKPSNLHNHAVREFKVLGWCDAEGNFTDDIQKLICQNMLELIDVFSEQGHSGFSASYLLAKLPKLMNYEPLSPLTGEPSEWMSRQDGVYQNRRCTSVFKKASGMPFNTKGKVFEDKSGGRYSNNECHTTITFPYWPTTEVVYDHFVPTELAYEDEASLDKSATLDAIGNWQSVSAFIYRKDVTPDEIRHILILESRGKRRDIILERASIRLTSILKERIADGIKRDLQKFGQYNKKAWGV